MSEAMCYNCANYTRSSESCGTCAITGNLVFGSCCANECNDYYGNNWDRVREKEKRELEAVQSGEAK